MDSQIKILSDLIAERSGKEAEFHPIDRFFLEPFIDEILKLDRNDFLLYNLEQVNILYAEYLMLCLPELWEEITIDDLTFIAMQFTNSFSFFSLILFTYKYVEINIIDLIFRINGIKIETRNEVKMYVKNQYANFFKTEGDFFFFEKDAIGVKIGDWSYIKQRLLLDNRISPALESVREFEHYVKDLS